MFKRYVFIEGLTNLHGSNGKYLINNDGQIRDVKGNELPYRRDDDGNKIVHCLGWDGERDYRVIDLVAIQFKSLYIPQTDYDKVIAFTIDGNPENVHARNIGYRFEGGKLECKERPGFYYVPGLTSCAINENGDVINVKELNFLSVYITKAYPEKNIKGGYGTFTSRFVRGKSVALARHRALCLVFKEYPDNVDTLAVNHINGIPGDDRLDNLEWVTRGENNQHAYENDLKNQHMRVLVRNVYTGEVTEYYSISECSRQLGYATDETIRFRLYKSKFCRVFADGTQVKLKSDQRDWIIPEDVMKAVREARSFAGLPIKVRNCKTLEEKKYETVQEASRDLGIQSSTITSRFSTRNEKPLFGYQFKEQDDKSPWRSFTEKEYRASLIPGSFEIHARNLFSNEERVFSSRREAERFLNKPGILGRLREESQPLYSDGWQVKYSHEVWKDVDNFEEVIYKLQKDIMARHEATGHIILADSASKLAEHLNCDPKAIRNAALTRGNMVYKGYRFRLGINTEAWPATNLN